MKEYKYDSPLNTAASVVDLLKQIRDFLEAILEEMGFDGQNNKLSQSRINLSDRLPEVQKEKINEA